MPDTFSWPQPMVGEIWGGPWPPSRPDRVIREQQRWELAFQDWIHTGLAIKKGTLHADQCISLLHCLLHSLFCPDFKRFVIPMNISRLKS